MNNYIERLLAKLKNSYFAAFPSSEVEHLQKDEKEEIIQSQNPIIPMTKLEEHETWDIQVSAAIENTDKNIMIDGLNFCTIVGKEYLFKVLAFYESLKMNSDKFNLFICCMDQLTFSFLQDKDLKNVILIPVKSFENPTLKKIKKERKINEYCWTLKAPFMELLFRKYNIPRVLYCDSDLFFFSNPQAIFDEWREFAVYLCPQRDSKNVEEVFGKFQAGLIGFKNNFHGRKSLKWWREQCLNWCSQERDGENFGDQKYLDKIPIYFHHIKISTHLGIDAAPWNCIYNNNYKFTKQENNIYIDDQKLIVFHFACLSIFDENQFDLWSLSPLKINKFIKNNIYIPYLQTLRQVIKDIKHVDTDIFNQCVTNKEVVTAKTFYGYTKLRREMDQYDTFCNFGTIVSQNYILQFSALYLSLAEKIKNFHIWTLCVDSYTYDVLDKMKLSHITLINIAELENEELKNIKNTRSLQEYCWTLKPYLCSYILLNYEEVDHIIYCDADKCFFSDPTPLLEEWGLYSIFLCRQRGTPDLERKFGMYQAGLIGFKREKNSLDILSWWKMKCLENCSTTYNDYYNSWGDQKYLDGIPNIFGNIKIITNIGINVAPWNLVMNNNHNISQKNKQIYIDNEPLISYHFGSMRIINKNEFDIWFQEPLFFAPDTLQYIYTPYIKLIKRANKKLQKTLSSTDISHLYAQLPINYIPQNPYTV
ncbi:glycosyl transferase [Bacillus thuringiensis]|uniref:Glycosyl transferase n=1 Tax=Bacillus thuringiensis TaxID=1428 RepID=A0A437SE00_BACTU|nr:glycosyl transferase [Bacillus thuringiensis]MBG9539610.1 glycosyl transferase [Bacillus thuringiensis]RVU61836.1 glycosyl transferase [Bacillus thuringiensis]